MPSSPIPAAAATTFFISLPRSRTPVRGAGAGSAGRAAGRGDRRGDRGGGLRRDRAVGRRCRPGGPGGAGRGARTGGGVPFRRAFALVSADVLDRVLGAWLWTRAVQAGGGLVIAIDGKTVRGARNKTGKARTWSRPSRTGSARSSARSPWTRNPTRFPQCGSC